MMAEGAGLFDCKPSPILLGLFGIVGILGIPSYLPYAPSMPRSNIALLYVGGSIGMVMNRKTGRIEPMESLSLIHRAIPEMQREVALEFFALDNAGSSEVTPVHWEEIAAKIRTLYDRFDGFVVVHGTNTMSYTASALSFALQNLSKPVVLTGALLPINELAGDGRMNLIFAIRAAQLGLKTAVVEKRATFGGLCGKLLQMLAVHMR